MGKYLSEPIRIKNKEIPENQGISLQAGSDYHYPIGTPAFEVVEDILSDVEENVDVVCIHGDIFDSGNGEDTSKEVSEVITLLSQKVKKLIFVPGNHDLRGRKNPFESFDIPEDVITPISQFKPRLEEIHGVKILVANLLYDGNFIQTTDSRYSHENVEKFYRERLGDGKYLDVDPSTFVQMTQSVKESLEKHQPHILVTHVPAHPAPTMLMGDVQIGTDNVEVTHDEAFIQSEADKKGYSKEKLIDYWNKKSFLLGSNVFDGANFRNGIVAIYGHNHRGNKVDRINVDGKVITLFTGAQPKIS